MHYVLVEHLINDAVPAPDVIHVLHDPPCVCRCAIVVDMITGGAAEVSVSNSSA